MIFFHPHRSDGVRIQKEVLNTLTNYMGTGGNNVTMVAYSMHGGMVGRQDKNGPSGSGFREAEEASYTLTSSTQALCGVAQIEDDFQTVRRLTPIECERLQGFPDGWTEGQTDGHRYKQMGNAVSVPVVEFLVKRLIELA